LLLALQHAAPALLGYRRSDNGRPGMAGEVRRRVVRGGGGGRGGGEEGAGVVAVGGQTVALAGGGVSGGGGGGVGQEGGVLRHETLLGLWEGREGGREGERR